MRRIIHCRIQGEPPGLLMHRYPMEEIVDPEKLTKEEQAELAAYRDPDGELMVPAENLQRALVAGGSFVKVPKWRTAKRPVAACVQIMPPYLLLNQDTYEIDSRHVVIPSTKGRIVRHRPNFPEWELSFDIDYDDRLLTEEQVRRVLDNTGSSVGLLDFRPACTGSFGRFTVTLWDAEPKTAEQEAEEALDDEDEDEDG